MHWKATLFGLALLSLSLAVVGCSQPCCLRDCDEFLKRSNLRPDLECNPDIANQRIIDEIRRPPMTVDDLEREPNYITLAECIAMSLENGTIGTQSVRNFFNQAGILSTGNNVFLTTDDLVSFTGNQANGSDSVRVFALVPAIAASDIEASLARYDVVWSTLVNFNTVDLPGPQAGIQNTQATSFGTGFEKALPTGGVVDITFGDSPRRTLSDSDFNQNNGSFYRNPAIPSAFNPKGFFPNVSLGVSQPLLRNFGTDINSLLQQHPSSPSQQYGNLATAPPAIAIARVNFNQSRAEFERQVNFMVLNVETCYHTLYALYVNLYSTEQALRQSHMAWKISKAKYEAGQIPVTQFAQTRAQYEDFRAQRILAVNKVLEQERELRVLCGMKLEDGKRLVPVDTPTVSEFKPDWETAIQEALTLRPELVIAREDVKRRQLELIRERNGLLPDVRLEAGYTVHGFGSRLDGNGAMGDGTINNPIMTDNAFHSLASTHFADYNIGVIATVPLGYRAQHAAVRQDELRLAQAYLVLRDQERKAHSTLIVTYRNIISDYKVMIARRAQREAAAEQVEARFKEFVAGKTTVDFLLEAQRQWANALSQEYNAIANYNFDLVAFQFAKGTLLQHNSIQIAEGPLPHCVQVQAVDHERERAAAIAVREHAAILPEKQICVPDMPGQEIMLPTLPGKQMPLATLPAMKMDSKNRVPEITDNTAPVIGNQINQPAPLLGNQGLPTNNARPLPTGPTVAPVAGTVSPASVPTPPQGPSIDKR